MEKNWTNNPSIKIYINKIKNRITFKIKVGYYLELLMPGTTTTTKILGSNKSKITKDKNGETFPNLEIAKVVSVHCDIVNSDHLQDSKVLYTFNPSNFFGELLDISPKSFIFWKTFNSEFSYIEVWFTDQNSKPLETEGKINITLVSN